MDEILLNRVDRYIDALSSRPPTALSMRRSRKGHDGLAIARVK